MSAPDQLSFGRWFDTASDEMAGAGSSTFIYSTPRTLAQLMVGLIGVEHGHHVLDPCCGNGTLLSAARCASAEAMLHGQDIDPVAVAFTSLRLHLLGLANIRLGDALRAPAFVDKHGAAQFDRILCDPPLGAFMDPETRSSSLAAPGSEARRSETLFAAGVGNMLAVAGRAAIVLPRSFLRRKGPEAEVRAAWLERDLIEGVVSLPQGVLPWVKTALCVVVLSKQKHDSRRQNILFLDGSAPGVDTSRISTRFRDADVERLLEAYQNPSDSAFVTSVKLGFIGEEAIVDPALFVSRKPSHHPNIQYSLDRIRELDAVMDEAVARMDAILESLPVKR